MNSKDISTLQNRIDELGPWWEKISWFSEDIITGPGRSKKLLWEKLSDKIDTTVFKDKTILDLGCNAGGNILELSKFKPKKIIGVEGHPTFYKQAAFVIKYFNINAEVINYRFKNETSPEQYENDLGKFDIIFCFGLIYHFNRQLNLNLLRYIKNNSKFSYFSTQTFINKDRNLVDWSTTKEGTRNLFMDAGYKFIKDIYIKTKDDDWSALTNDWYFSTN